MGSILPVLLPFPSFFLCFNFILDVSCHPLWFCDITVHWGWFSRNVLCYCRTEYGQKHFLHFLYRKVIKLFIAVNFLKKIVHGRFVTSEEIVLELSRMGLLSNLKLKISTGWILDATGEWYCMSSSFFLDSYRWPHQGWRDCHFHALTWSTETTWSEKYKTLRNTAQHFIMSGQSKRSWTKQESKAVTCSLYMSPLTSLNLFSPPLLRCFRWNWIT